MPAPESIPPIHPGEILAEEYLAPFGQHVRDKVMFLNGLKFYRRVPPTH